MRIPGLLEKEVVLDYPLTLGGKEFKEVIIREYTGLDEEQVSQDDIRENIILVENIAVSRCIAEVKGTDLLPTPEEISGMPTKIVENLMLEVRKLTYGNNISFKGTCVKCKRALIFEENIDDFAIKKDCKNVVIQFRTPIVRGGKSYNKCYLKPITNGIRGLIFDKGKKTPSNKMNTTVYQSSIIRIENESGAHIIPTLDEVSGLTKFDRKQIEDSIGTVDYIDSSVDYLCPFCNTNNPVVLPIFDFLF